ncbi:MAG: DUF481 domain-containing protein [Bdellovibrionota bacterium]|mgnify:CR=1 FL=1
MVNSLNLPVFLLVWLVGVSAIPPSSFGNEENQLPTHGALVASCAEAKATLDQAGIKDQGTLDAVCAKVDSNGENPSIIVVMDAPAVTAPVVAKKPKFMIDFGLGGTIYSGNLDQTVISETSELTYIWRHGDTDLISNRLVVELDSSYLNVSGSEATTALVSVKVDHFIDNQWAVFVVSNLQHDSAALVGLSASELAGVLYSVFPIEQFEKHYLALSVSGGHQYTSFLDGTTDNDFMAFYRIKYAQLISTHLRIVTALWLGHSLYDLGTGEAMDFDDNYVLAQAKIEFLKLLGDRLSANVGCDFEHYGKPALGKKQDDLTCSFGIAYGFKK